MKRLLTVPEVCELLSVRPRTIRRWQRDGRIPFIRLPSGLVRFDEEELTTWLNQQRRTR